MDPAPFITARTRLVELGRSAGPQGPSAMGHPSEPVVVALCLDAERPFLAISEGNGHLGAGSTLWPGQVVDDTGAARPPWDEVIRRAGAEWALPWLLRLVRGEDVAEADLLASRARAGGRSEG